MAVTLPIVLILIDYYIYSIKTQDTSIKTQDTRHKNQDTRHEYQDTIFGKKC